MFAKGLSLRYLYNLKQRGYPSMQRRVNQPQRMFFASLDFHHGHIVIGAEVHTLSSRAHVQSTNGNTSDQDLCNTTIGLLLVTN